MSKHLGDLQGVVCPQPHGLCEYVLPCSHQPAAASTVTQAQVPLPDKCRHCQHASLRSLKNQQGAGGPAATAAAGRGTAFLTEFCAHFTRMATEVCGLQNALLGCRAHPEPPSTCVQYCCVVRT